ncbi:hypothetical protein H5410_038226 [Solanum commersonii]|uniref:Uncharacterized protein n=1 Tax=Solanum commersonii TaxID=4109 RepID=A0A9J5YA49_SOLCO|nr:hypothetical protein H5410_038226 [Solanum commersonii]
MDFDLENPLPFSLDEDTISLLFNIETHHMPSITYLQILINSDFLINIRESTISIILQISQPFDSHFFFHILRLIISIDSYPSIRYRMRSHGS